MKKSEYRHLARRFWQELQPLIANEHFYWQAIGDWSEVAVMRINDTNHRLELRFRGTPTGFKLWVHVDYTVRTEPYSINIRYALHADGTLHRHLKPVTQHPYFTYRATSVCGRYRPYNLVGWRQDVEATIRQMLTGCFLQRIAQYEKRPITCADCPHELPCLLNSR